MTGKPKQQRILLVDDDPLLRKLRTEILGQHGYAVNAAAHLEDAAAHCRSGNYDLVLLNGQEDEKVALEICEEIKRANPNQVVIVLTMPSAYIPPDSCPNDVVYDGPRELLMRVDAALSTEAGSPL